MKTIITGLILIIGTNSLAQSASGYEFKYSLKGNAAEMWLVIKNLTSDIQIEATSGSEVIIQSKNYKGLPEKAKGLKPLSSSGPENTGIGLNMGQEGNTITIASAHRAADDADYTFYLPKNINLKIEYNGWQAGDVQVTGMAGEIEAKSQVGDMEFIDVTGPIVAYTLSADLEVTFAALSSDSPTSLGSTSGDIDVTLPASTKAIVNMATVSGGIYTAFDFDMGDQEMSRIGGQNARGKLNGGGVELGLKSVSGDIYIRKPE